MGQRCTYEGCRAWAKKGGTFCSAHPDGHPWGGGGAPKGNQNARGHGAPKGNQNACGHGPPKGNQNARKHGAYAEYVPVVALKEALELPPGDLRPEIAVARAVLQELLSAGLESEALVAAVDVATRTLVRLMRANLEVSEAQTSLDQEDIRRAIVDLGPGGADGSVAHMEDGNGSGGG